MPDVTQVEDGDKAEECVVKGTRVRRAADEKGEQRDGQPQITPQQEGDRGRTPGPLIHEFLYLKKQELPQNQRTRMRTVRHGAGVSRRNLTMRRIPRQMHEGRTREQTGIATPEAEVSTVRPQRFWW